MAYRLGIDMGTNSIGWAVLELENGTVSGLVDAGVRIFSDGRNPKDGASLAAQRRQPRSARRNRDRKLVRKRQLLTALKDYGLLPRDDEQAKSLQHLDPWILRAKGLDAPLTPYELGRALFHLQQRRGFQSNRKTDRGDNEGGAIKEGAARAEQMLLEKGCRTLGELFGKRRLEAQSENAERPEGQRDPQPPARVRPTAKGNKISYDYYPTRALIRVEFEALWQAQAPHHPELLTDKAKEKVADAIFFQRPLKPQVVGKCTLCPDEDRAHKALPSLQRIRIYQDVNHLSYRLPGEKAQTLTLEQRDAVVRKLLSTGKLSFDALRKTVLKLPPGTRFNFEVNRKDLKGDETAANLASKKRWGPDWRNLPLDTQDAVVERLLEDEDEDKLVQDLMSEHGLSEEIARNVCSAPLPITRASLSLKAARTLLPALKSGVISYDKAVNDAFGQSHSQLDHHGEILDRLPYYGKVLHRHTVGGSGRAHDRPEVRFGKLANPTVHVALNQLRRVVNDLTDRFGSPEEIVVELARDLPLSAKGKSELKKQQGDNEKANDKRRELLKELGQDDTYANRLRVRLWEELNPDDPLERRCPFSGEQISKARLFSDAFEIEHILPKSRTLDDSPANKTLSARAANRYKREHSPYEAFGQNREGYDWEDIVQRCAILPPNNAWRFGPDAMDRFENEETDFADRQLVSTQYIARLAASYLVWLVGDPVKVWPIPGRMTSDLRHHWGLNTLLSKPGKAAKNRDDHRHHAIDAIVVGLTDRSLMQALARDAGREREEGDARLIERIAEPWPDFRSTVGEQIGKIIVSHKPDHGIQGSLHNDTAYGLASEADKDGRHDVVRRVPLESLKTFDKLDLVRDDTIRQHLKDATEGLSGTSFTNALIKAGETMTPPVRRIRILERMKVIPISHGRLHPFKAYKGDGNYCYDVWMGPKNKWTGEVISRFDAHQPGFDPQSSFSRSGGRLLMRLRVGDMIEIGNKYGQQEIMRVQKMTAPSGGAPTLTLAEHNEANVDARNRDKGDLFTYRNCTPSALQKHRAVQLRISPSGRVYRDRRYGLTS